MAFPRLRRHVLCAALALGVAVAPVLVVLYLCSLIFLARYRITRESHAETLAELERRRLQPS